MLSKLKAIFETIWSWTSTISGILLLFNIAVIIANILLRRFAGAPIFGSTEIVRYCSLASAAFALAQNEWYDGNVKMTLLLEKIGEKAAALIRTFVDLLCFVGFVYVLTGLCKQFVMRLGDGAISQDLGIPIWLVAFILLAGFFLLTVCFFCKSAIQIGMLAGLNVTLPVKPPEPGMEDIEKMDLLLKEGGM
ncbi:MAG: TRAP transporter small permease [Clostridiales Family XIII bacterium]|jgi:TRAP-type C4-dicarboxylate transport system permease small subunit|nr:TRAP transporter small permease [Clostridiales Family XIII bacterium]